MTILDEQTSLYEFLGVAESASLAEVKASYQARRAEIVIEELSSYSISDQKSFRGELDALETAHRILTEPGLRTQYDQARRDSVYPGVGIPKSLEAGERSTSVSLADLVQRRGAEKKSYDKKLTAKEAAQDVFERFNRPRGEAPRPERRRPLEQPAKVVEVEAISEKAVAVSTPVSRGVSQRQEFSLSATVLAKLTPDTEFTGVLLRELRESVQLELEDLERITKVSKRYLRALEGEDFKNLPAGVYVRGFIRHYAKVLGLDSNRVSKSYMTVMERARSRSQK